MVQALWKPTAEAVTAAQMSEFRRWVNEIHGLSLKDYFALHAWSVAEPGLFWQAVWAFMEVIASQKASQIYAPGIRMQDTQWFVGARLNFAENLLRYRDEKMALVFCSESGERQTLTYAQLYQEVQALALWMREVGVVTNDRIVGWLPNSPATVIAMLATASIGAIWSACSPDFGLQGLIDRFSQIEPKILFAAKTHTYGGKTVDHAAEIRALQQQLPSLQQTVVISSHESLPKSSSGAALTFNALPFHHPLYILFSSGTTGKPKCMVHSAGGTLLQHLKELRLHTDLRRNDRICFYTTCAWMMWHWLVSGLAVGATVVLYEGSPFFPKKSALWDLVDEWGMTVLGVGAKIIESFQKFGLRPRDSHALTSLRTLLTTGSPLLPPDFDYVYRDVKTTVCLSSISGGSDIISCFALGNPTLPVYRGELQCLGLGMDVKIFNEQGQPVVNEKGELVCATPFPSMPVHFWNDPQGKKYQQAYFDRFPNVWTHGDYAQLTEHGGLIIYGRSDATLKPGGVRVGTAEIYQQVEKFPEITECLAVGQHFAGSERILLFVVMRENESLTDALMTALKTAIRNNTSPHHVPAKIIAAPDLPRTQNGKLMEILVKKIINHEPITQTEALANPDSLTFFRQLIQ
jgi:acetoacetyl-CoA synthetase